MISTLAVAASPVSSGLGRRIGQFAVGTFAGICAAFVPRLILMIGPPANSTAVTVEAFQTGYVFAALVFSLLIGGVALILEWDGARSPRDTFMAALGVPALLTGVFSTANLSDEAIRQAEKVKSISDERVREEGIPVEETPHAPVAPARVGWLSEWHLMPTAFAQERTVPQAKQQPQGSDLGVRYREPRYWVVVYSASTKDGADRRVAELGSRYGALTVQKAGNSYFVCPAGGSFPYSEAVSKAVELKRRSQGTLSPKLVRAG